MPEAPSAQGADKSDSGETPHVCPRRLAYPPCPGCDHECLSCGAAVPQGGSACEACRPMMEADARG